MKKSKHNVLDVMVTPDVYLSRTTLVTHLVFSYPLGENQIKELTLG